MKEKESPANIKRQVDEMITIPMNGHVQNLNASVAAAILMYGGLSQSTIILERQ